ncbi:MAG: HD domain-containing protein [Lachnospiraceae bacterium]|nr:HD domain-containing protein [Lachnospiraceae bacterium]
MKKISFKRDKFRRVEKGSIDRDGMKRALTAIGGVIVNVLAAYIAYSLGMPLFFDTIGTIGVAVICGTFPAMMTALTTNYLCGLFNNYSIYFSTLNIIVALIASAVYDKDRFKNPRSIAKFIFMSAGICGGIGTIIQLTMMDDLQFEMVNNAVEIMAEGNPVIRVIGGFIINILLNIIDKMITLTIALTVTYMIPEKDIDAIRNSGWRQKSLTREEIMQLRARKRKTGHSLKQRITRMLLVTSAAIAIVMTVISLVRYQRSVLDEDIAKAKNTATFMASVLDDKNLDGLVRNGAEDIGYRAIEDMLLNLVDNTDKLKMVSVFKARNDGLQMYFDSEADNGGYRLGDVVKWSGINDEIKALLLSGEEVGPVYTSGYYGELVCYYVPIRNEKNETVAYAEANIEYGHIMNYVRKYLFGVLFVFSGFFLVALGFGLWMSDVHLVYPINSLAADTENFMKGGDDQDILEKNVRKMRSLDIRTDDEIEVLYKAMCRMTANMSEQMRDIRHFADSTEKMQNGLIVTMADMVENRDADTGAHIQKTAAYVRIILNGLKAKGYYTSKLTDKYISAVVMSAPLHDIGKINIPDSVLNKPGKLNDEEYEIMKTHTTAGKKIIENAISTLEGENYLKEARNMAGYHHERWDGKGYPEGLRGEVIPLSARVMAVADVFDALVSPRVYKPPFTFEKAIEIITEGSGKQFDPKCVEVFLESLGDVKMVLRKYSQGIVR